ncbi:hypothetical protein E2562_017540, partial [Oryza meyeriana var. granulata]
NIFLPGLDLTIGLKSNMQPPPVFTNHGQILLPCRLTGIRSESINSMGARHYWEILSCSEASTQIYLHAVLQGENK